MQFFLEKGFSADNRRDEVLLGESSEAPQQNDAASSVPMVVTDSVLALRRPTRVSQPLDRYGFLALTSQSSNDPRIYGETMLDIDSDKWLEAMRSEMDSMLSNQVWTLIHLPKDIKLVGCKWVYKRTLGADREIDVKMAFLDGFIEEEIYMDQPEGFISVKEEQKDYDFIKNEFDLCIYKKISGSSFSGPISLSSQGLPRYYVVVWRGWWRREGEMGGGTLEGRNSDEGKAHGGRRSNTVGRKHFDGGGGTSIKCLRNDDAK
ncbi:UNVERIFIED_CONTAM: hypothetical protein Sradi_5122800 [Sesamum radiatum]|uniref:Reverse transcriptase Ty1/copia-type domain-containing protein n=1 Tax=Sesamum radiatum TaxID=300843 RepID=A0AAW2M209_SESRA